MSKKNLYIVIILLTAVMLYLLFVPQQSVQAPSTTKEVVDETTISPTKSAIEPRVTEDETVVRTGGLEFNGTLEGFADGKDEFLGSYKYALVNDGIELLRIDLRPLVGYDVTNLELDLGVKLGETVTLTGYLENGEFIVETIN